MSGADRFNQLETLRTAAIETILWLERQFLNSPLPLTDERLSTRRGWAEHLEDLAREVIEGDGEVNRMYLDLEQQCIELLALQQPVASDLRFIASSFKVITDLERIGDHCKNIAEAVVKDNNLDVEKFEKDIAVKKA